MNCFIKISLRLAPEAGKQCFSAAHCEACLCKQCSTAVHCETYLNKQCFHSAHRKASYNYIIRKSRGKYNAKKQIFLENLHVTLVRFSYPLNREDLIQTLML